MTIDQFLHERMGKCWHEMIQNKPHWIWNCSCGEHGITIPEAYTHSYNPSYSTDPKAYLDELIPWAMKQEWWQNFCIELDDSWLTGDDKSYNAVQCSMNIMLSCSTGSEAIAKFLGWEGE